MGGQRKAAVRTIGIAVAIAGFAALQALPAAAQAPITMKLSTATLQAGANLTVEADVKNVSSIPGDEVAQLYLVFPRMPGTPLRALRGFERVNIPAGQTKHVTFTLNPRDLSCVNPDGVTHVAPGAYTVWVGGGQPNAKVPGQQAALTIQGEQKLLR